MGGIGNVIGKIGGFLQKAMPIVKAISSFVPGLGPVVSALSSFGQVSKVFQSLFSKNDQQQRQAKDQADKSRDIFGIIGEASKTLSDFKSKRLPGSVPNPGQPGAPGPNKVDQAIGQVVRV
jgi:hypothetical protein